VETSIKQLINTVLDVTNSKANVVYNTQTSGGVSRMKADLTLAKEKLRFTPSINLVDGLRLTLQRDTRFK
jgi:nucleoside-diphosphate-sugar epimerase